MSWKRMKYSLLFFRFFKNYSYAIICFIHIKQNPFLIFVTLIIFRARIVSPTAANVIEVTNWHIYGTEARMPDFVRLKFKTWKNRRLCSLSVVNRKCNRSTCFIYLGALFNMKYNAHLCPNCRKTKDQNGKERSIFFIGAGGFFWKKHCKKFWLQTIAWVNGSHFITFSDDTLLPKLDSMYACSFGEIHRCSAGLSLTQKNQTTVIKIVIIPDP